MRACQQHVLKIILLALVFIHIGIFSLSARKVASIVICAETGTIHHEQNADAITHPASLTKMMTLFMTFQALRNGKLKLDQKLPVSKHATKQIPCKLWLKAGSTITVRQAILAMITKSANDAAVVLAETLGKGTESQFAKAMTQQARKLGMIKTVFKNSSGVPNKHQITTARDMAILSRALYKHFPDYFPLFKTEKFVHKGVVHANHNKLLGKVKGVDGIKTGFINASGFNLAASMVRDNRRIIAVVMGGETAKARDKKMIHLLETTHAAIKGKKQVHPNDEYASLDDLLFALGAAGTYGDPKEIKKADYQAELIESKYTSVNDLLEIINEEEPTKKKARPKVIRTKKVKSKSRKNRLHRV